ncbi:MAG: hemE [Gammaproteobacteria bacterium]|jgi:uroporphyrinogen decarboxylase|nr:hemE [Gammaproteobacteria bacterium]
MTQYNNTRLLQALKRQPVDVPPVWLMRQAGRYLPEYRALRTKAGDFLTLCQTPQLATEITLQPLRRFDLDAAILFSDILTIPHAMGLGLSFQEGEGPQFAKRIETARDVKALPILEVEENLDYVLEAVRMIQQELQGRVPLIGFAGSPWTVACYMIEGSSHKNFINARKMAYQAPEVLTALLEKLITATTAYLKGQILAGVDVVMLFDTWGGLLTPAHYPLFSLTPMQKIITNLKADPNTANTPIILFSKGAVSHLEVMADSGADALGLDWTSALSAARTRVGAKVCVQGNLDPALLFSTPEKIKAAVKSVLNEWGPHPGLIVNLGHGIEQHTPIENVQALIAAVHEG